MYANESYVVEVFRNGAMAYVLKQSDTSELVQAIHVVMSGKTYIGAPFSEKLIEAYAQRTQAIVQDPYETLTGREREILQLVAEGHSNMEIAERLVISVRTVEGYRATMMSKLGLKTKLELFRYATWRGILPVDSD
jgi:DNA-binding NarL/FixJ family response regulator